MARQPNIIFFFSDQQRWDTVGCYGQPLDVTPNLDRMAAEGVRFQHAFTCQPVCGPARACLQTGQYATETGNFRNNITLPMNAMTIAHRLRDAGYEVGYIGKWHLASTGGLDQQVKLPRRPEDCTDANYRERAVPPERRGGYEDYWLASDTLEFTSHGYGGYMFDADMNKVTWGHYRVDALTDFAEDYLRSRDGQRPFFLFLSYIEPHHQNDRNRYEGPEGSKERFKDFVVPGDLADTYGDWRENYPDYLGCCHALDTGLGRIRATLAELGLADDTLLIYTSDHGSHFRTRNSEYKRSCHEGCVRIPMVACGPGFQGGKVVDHLVSLIDIPPTLLAAGGVATPKTMQGLPLQPLVERLPADWPEDVFMQISESNVERAVRTQRWKYAVRAPGKIGSVHPDSDTYVESFLYDLDNDPHERHNLVCDPAYAEVRAQLADRIRHYLGRAHEPEAEILPAERATLDYEGQRTE